MRKMFFMSILSVFLSKGFWQDLELLGLEYARYPDASIEESDSVEVNFTEIEIAAMFPAVRKDQFSLLAGGTYRHITPESTEREFESDLFFLSLRLVGVIKLTDKESLILNAAPAISTTDDSGRFKGENFLMQGGALYQKKVSERFSYTLGILSTSRFGSPLVLPSIGISHLGEKMRLDVNLPLLIRTMWNYKNPFSYGLKLSVNGSQYNFDNQNIGTNEVDLARLSRNRIGPEIQYRIKGPLVFTLFGGIAANRTYEFELTGSDDVDFTLENGPFIAVRLALKPQMKTN